MLLKVKRLAEHAKLPTMAHYGDICYDLYSSEEQSLLPGHTTKIKTGIALEFPDGYGGLILDRSSVVTKDELFVVGGVIDQGFRNEIIVCLFNPIQHIVHGADGSHHVDHVKRIHVGQKIAQLALFPIQFAHIEEVEELSVTERNLNGFGSSGKF